MLDDPAYFAIGAGWVLQVVDDFTLFVNAQDEAVAGGFGLQLLRECGK